MKTIISKITKTPFILLSALSSIAFFTARVGAGAASMWGRYQPQLPDELKR